MSKKLVDGEFLSELLDGSFEATMGQVDEVIASQPELFGCRNRDEVRTIGTFSNHVIALNDNGEFFRAGFSVSEETGAIELGEIERINIPVKEVSELGGEVRTESIRAVKAILEGNDNEADVRLGSLFELVQAGVSLTAEGVEDSILAAFEDEPDWLIAVRENTEGMAKFVGADANKDFPRPKFETFIEEGDNGDERYRKIVDMSLRELRESLHRMQDSISVARRSSGEESSVLENVAVDFTEFTSEFGDDLDATVGLIEDAISLVPDGTLKSLARVHDNVATRVNEMGLAAAFTEKFARRFDQPQA